MNMKELKKYASQRKEILDNTIKQGAVALEKSKVLRDEGSLQATVNSATKESDFYASVLKMLEEKETKKEEPKAEPVKEK